MNDHPTGGEYGDGATARLRNSKQRQKRQLDSRERPAICSTAWLRVREKKPDMKVRFPLLHHQGLPGHDSLLGRIGGNAGSPLGG